jgi:predicted DNA-binding antitoxin AbrB/MazE fold protein
MHAIEAIYNGTNFMPIQPIPVKEDYKVVITFIEPVKKDIARPPFEYGSMSGKMWISDDFDAPLDDFKEYME